MVATRNSQGQRGTNNNEVGDGTNRGNNTTTNGGKQSWKNNKKNKQNKKKDGHKKKALDFVPSTKEMNNHIFQCPHETSDKNQYNRTVEELASYVRKDLDYGQDMAYLIRNEKAPTMSGPEKINHATASEEDKFMWKEQMKELFVRKKTYKQNLSSLYSVIMGQCSQAMKDELSANETFKEIDVEQTDCVVLLGIIRSVAYKFHSKKHPFSSLYEAQSKLYSCKQAQNESVTDYKTRFTAMVKALEFYGGALGKDPGLTAYVLEADGYTTKVMNLIKANDRQRKIIEKAQNEAIERYKAMAFLRAVSFYYLHKMMTMRY